MGGRLHPAFIGVRAFSQIVPLLLVLVAGPFELPFVLGVGAISAIGSAVAWWRFWWRVEDDALIIEQGLLQRRRRVIPLARIQSVEVVRRVRHRVFGVVALRVESVGGSDTEGQLDALDPAVAARLRAVLLRLAPAGAEQTAEPDADAGEVLVHLGPRDLVIAGVTGGRVGVAAAILGFGQELWFDRLVRSDVLQSAWEQASARQLPVVAAVVVVGLLAVFAISVLATALAFWDLTLTRSGDNLHLRRGLLDQRSDTIPLARVQAVRIEENPVRRALGLAAVKIEVAGRAGAGDGRRQTDVVFPGGDARMARGLADRLLDASVADTALRPMPEAARTRRLVRAGLATAALLLPAAFDARALWLTLLGVACFSLAVTGYRSLGWADTGGHLLARSGVAVRRLWLVPAAAVQSVEARATPFQRRRGLASVTLHIPRSGGAGDPVMVDLAEPDARGVTARATAASTAAGRRQIRLRRAELRRS